MIKYFYIIKFLITHDLTFLKECWEVEGLENKRFTWVRLFYYLTRYRYRYIIMWRLANIMYPNKGYTRTAKQLNKYLDKIYKIDISVNVKMGKGFRVPHLVGIVVGEGLIFGENITIYQNTVIGTGNAIFGDNISIYSNSVINSKNIRIGNNVVIGAMSYVDGNIPDNCIVYTEKTNKIKIKAH